jgi:hypothetical protein
MWNLFVILCVVSFGWMFYMMIFRTDDWLRLVKDEQERKAKRRERTDDALKKGAVFLADWLSKK